MPAHSDTDYSEYDQGTELQPITGEGGTATGSQMPADGTVTRRGTGGTGSRAGTDLERRLVPASRAESFATTVWKWTPVNVWFTAGALFAVVGSGAVLTAMYITDTQPIHIDRQYLQPVNPPPFTVACHSGKPTEGPGITAEVTGTIDEPHVLTCCVNTACDGHTEETTFTVNPSDWDKGKVDKEGTLYHFEVYKFPEDDRLRGKELTVTATLSQAPTSAKSILPTAGGTFAAQSTLPG